jgi:hypothetical protein
LNASSAALSCFARKSDVTRRILGYSRLAVVNGVQQQLGGSG